MVLHLSEFHTESCIIYVYGNFNFYKPLVANRTFCVVFIRRISHQVAGEEWLGFHWTVPALYQGSPSVYCQCPWRINTNVSSVSKSWGSLSRLSAATASAYTASSSSPGRLEVLRPPTTVWKAHPSPASPNAYTFSGHASAHPVFLFLLASGNSWHPSSVSLRRLILHMTGL